MSFHSEEAMKRLPYLWNATNEKIDDLIAAILTLAEITNMPSADVDSIFVEKRKMLKNRK